MQQFLHQRHKSIGPVSSAPSVPAAGFKGPAKRAAFGDVTNVSKGLGGRGDETKGAKKAVMVTTNHASASFLNKENAVRVSKDSLSRPAQRPAALASNKSKISTTETRVQPLQRKPNGITTTTTTTTTSTTKESAYKLDIDIPQQQQQRTTKSTTVTQTKSSFPSSQPAPEPHSLQPRHHKSQPQLKQQQPALRRTQSKVEKPKHAPERVSLAAADIGPLVMPALVEDFLASDDSYLDPLSIPSEEASRADVNHDDSHVEEVMPKLPHISEEATIDIGTFKEGITLALSETDEYWDEEDDDDEEYDDQDQAYTTAHSTRSRDMTLGNATTILAPRVSSRVQRELEEARIEVEQTMTPEEIDEETWDVSMVAEYGEEIFAYLRELEVSQSSPYILDTLTYIFSD